MNFLNRVTLSALLFALLGITTLRASSSSDFSSHSSSGSSSHSHSREKRCKGIGWHSLKGAHRFYIYEGHEANEKQLIRSFKGGELNRLKNFLTGSRNHSHFFLVAIDEKGKTIHKGRILVKERKVKFCQPPCVLSHLLPEALVNQPYEAEIELAKRSSSATFKLVHGRLPNGLKLSSKGTVFGIPTEEGRFEFIVLATSKCGASREVTLRIQVGCPPVLIITKEFPDGDVGVSYSETIAVVDNESETTFTLLIGELPPGLTLSPQGVIAGTPTEAGTYDFIVEATNACGQMSAASYSIAIANPCTAPVILTTTLTTGLLNQPYGPFAIETSGGVAPITFSVVSGILPPGITLSETGILSGIPTSSDVYNFTVEARSSCGLTVTQLLTLSIFHG